MEIYKRKVGYEGLSNYRAVNSTLPITASSYVITATTRSKLYFPIMLTQDMKDIGIYTDLKNPTYEITEFFGNLDLTNLGNINYCLPTSSCRIIFTPTLPSYYGASDGQILASISNQTDCPLPTTVLWSGPNGFTANTLTISNLITGNYTIKLTDANCNFTLTNYYLPGPNTLSSSVQVTNSQTNVTTAGGCNGSAQVFPSGGVPPYTYTWYITPPPYTGSTIYNGPSLTLTGLTGLCAGSYVVQILDSSGTTISQSFSITEPTPISGSVVTTKMVDCFGGSTGSITVLATGGLPTSGYIYSISPGGQTINNTGSATFTSLNVSNSPYTITITDSPGNTITLPPVSITQPLQVGFNLGVPYPYNGTYYTIGCYGSLANITVTPFNGTPSYTIEAINQNGGGFNASNPLQAGTYTIKVKDRNQCPAPDQTIKLLQYPRFKIVATGSCSGGSVPIEIQYDYPFNANTTIPISSITFEYYLNGSGPVATGSSPITITGLSSGTNTINARVQSTNCWPLGSTSISAGEITVYCP